jgi:hypothetical protein
VARGLKQCVAHLGQGCPGEGLDSRDFLVPLRSSNSLWRAGRLQADFGRQLDSVNSTTLVWLASELSE